MIIVEFMLTFLRYLKKGDVYVHADLQGAATVVIKNNPKSPDSPIPPSTLSQAGSLAVACSSAWDSKAGMSAWWVNADQVSKSAPTGEFLPTGSFNVRGQKNFLPPAILLLGFGVAFLISEESKTHHVKHRVSNDASENDQAESAQGEVEMAMDGAHDEDMPELDHEHETVGEGDESEVEEENATGDPPQKQSNDGPIIFEDSEDAEIEMSQLQIEDGSRPEEQPELDPESDSDEDVSQATTGTQTPNQQSNAMKGTAPPKRGKKGKAKKIATKYKDQDEEDRLAAQQLIGAAAGQEKAQAEASAKAAHEAELAFQKERRRAQHQRTQKETAEHEALRQKILSQGPEIFDDNEEEKLTALESLVGTPLKGDEILEAIPVCAPWAALGKYKYKAKLQPGTQKKGKAVKEILGKWLFDAGVKGKVDLESADVERLWPREVDLLKGWKVEEVTNTIPVGKVRVMIAGASAGATAGSGGKGGQQSKGRSGKGSKKQR